ncbi:neopullulanase [Clostridium zeae]|uniref:Neopullulanase n=1 Tax=Clostridium zeae TaxID=2759022 RepID=A0ABQ1ECN6_9CLOT|nr:glycoside hydrolase family 13 protein [Clostridium zeae]GFZ32421.1 neopullulanase [Clostridium zeae]
MNKHAVYHRAKSNYAFAINENTLAIRLRTASKDIDEVKLHYGDYWEEVDGRWVWRKEKVNLKIEFETDLFTYWRVDINPKDYTLKYGFELIKGQDRLMYIERGFFDVDDKSIENDINSYFSFAYINSIDIFKSPSWAEDTIWYQIFPDRFCNGDKSNDPENVHHWEEKILGTHEFYGGDLRGIIEKLDYLKDLGITGLYLTPIFKSPSSHKYDTTDYFEIDPHFGTKEELRALVKEAHSRNIRIMLDAVFNHIGVTSKQFKDVIEKGEKSIYYNWFYIQKWPVTDNEGKLIGENYRNFSTDMPKLNTENEEVIQYLLKISKYWIEEFDIDAWRLDAANEVDHEFWRKFRHAVKACGKDIYILGETWFDSHIWLQGDQFDATTNYPQTKPILEWAACRSINAIDFQRMYVEAMLRYSDNVNKTMFNLLDSHDTPRIFTLAKENKNLLEICYVLLYTLPGSPCIFYGSEYAIAGENDPYCRLPMPWEKEKPEIFEKLKHIIKLRKQYKALSGTTEFIMVEEEEVIIKKVRDEEELYLIINLSNSEKNYDLSSNLIKTAAVNLMDGKDINVANITVNSEGFVLIK